MYRNALVIASLLACTSLHASEDTTGWHSLPTELRLKIIGQVEINDNLNNVALVSKDWRAISMDDFIWRPYVLKGFPQVTVAPKEKESWRDAYMGIRTAIIEMHAQTRITIRGLAASDESIDKLEISLKGTGKCPLSLPPDFGALIPPKFQKLYLRGNELTDLPLSFSKLTWLRYVNLANNHLETIPEWFTNFQKLEGIDLSDNPLSDVASLFRFLKDSLKPFSCIISQTTYDNMNELAEFKENKGLFSAFPISDKVSLMKISWGK